MSKPKISIVRNEIIAPMGENFQQFYKHFFSDENHCETQLRDLDFFQKKYKQSVRNIEKFDNKTIPSRLRRRMSFLTQMIVSCASLCLKGLTYDNKNLAIVFATGWGELETTEKLLLSIVDDSEDPVLSPTQFHNSVHNTAAGYLGIVLKVQGPTLTISQENQSLETALEAAILLINSQQTALALVGGGDTYFRFSVLDAQNNRYPKIFSCGVSCFLLKENHGVGPYIETLKTCGTVHSEQQAVLYFKELTTVLIDENIDILWLSGLPSSYVTQAKLEFYCDICIVSNEENPSYPTSSGEDFTSILAILQCGKLPRHINDHVVKGQANKDIRKVLYVKASNGVYKSFIIWT